MNLNLLGTYLSNEWTTICFLRSYRWQWVRYLGIYLVSSNGTCTRNPDFGYSTTSHKEIRWTQVEQGLSSFFTKFLPYLIIFQSGGYWRKLKSSNMAKIWQKMKKLAFNPFLSWIWVPDNQTSGYPLHH